MRDRAKIEEVIGSYVALRNAGGGSMKGLCPFHDEKTPSFNVTPSRGFFHCFGCSEGGDVIDFVQKIENLSFVEAVERLADRVGIQLRYAEGGSGPRVEPGLRTRLMEAHRLAAEYFSEQLATPDALPARQFLAERGFDRAAAEHFGVGFAPRTGTALMNYLRGKGFRDSELVAGGLIREGGYDFFRGRLLWPIRDTGKSVVGFGARRIFEDDRVAAKYLNTPETPLYKKSQVLYGLDLARQSIGKKSQAVIVEGYSDVMAAHLSGVDTAVASCGTAFGDDHARLLRRLMGNHDAFHGEVIFTFDGDAAGQAAAIKVFKGDHNFIAQTYVAVEPSGLDPCDLRLQHGEAAVRELVARRVPLYRFVMNNVLGQYDLDRADGRVAALRAAAPLVASIRDAGMVTSYAQELAKMLGTDVEEVRREVVRAASQSSRRPSSPNQHQQAEPEQPQATQEQLLPHPKDPSLQAERETCKLIMQVPGLFPVEWDGLQATDFTHPAYATTFAAAVRAGQQTGQTDPWVQRVKQAADNPLVEKLIIALAVEPPNTQGLPDGRYVVAYSSQVKLLTVMREIAQLKSRLQRTNPVDNPTSYNQMFSALVALEARRKQLQARSLGAQD